MRREESGEAAFRETHPWLAALVERHKRPSGAWPQKLREGYAMMLFLGQHKFDQVRHLIGGPALRDVRRWTLTDLAALELADRGLDGSPDSPRAVCELLGKVVTQYAEGLGDSGDITFTLSLDAMATKQHVGVGRDGHVTGLIRDDFIDLDRAEAICSDPDELEGFVGERTGS
jgi:predicted dehydrogenase